MVRGFNRGGWLGCRLLWTGVVTLWLLVVAGCQSPAATPTLQPGETEIPFETVVLDEDGAVELNEGTALVVITNQAELADLQPLISPAAFQQVQAVNLDEYSLLALFRIPGAGCASFGVTVDRLTQLAETVTVHASDWQPLSGHACAPDSASAYHIVQARKSNIQLEAVELNLEIQKKERD